MQNKSLDNSPELHSAEDIEWADSQHRYQWPQSEGEQVEALYHQIDPDDIDPAQINIEPKTWDKLRKRATPDQLKAVAAAKIVREQNSTPPTQDQ